MNVNIEMIVMLAHKAESMPVYPDARFPPSLYYRFLQAYCECVKPKLCVELGVCGGGASLHMCLGGAGTVIGVDNVNKYPDNMAYVRGHFDNFWFWQEDSVSAAEAFFYRWCGGPGEGCRDIQLLFIDTVHTYERVMAEYNAWRQLLDYGAMVCLDDLNHPEMGGVWDEMPEPKIRLDFLHSGGFGVVLL